MTEPLKLFLTYNRYYENQELVRKYFIWDKTNRCWISKEPPTLEMLQELQLKIPSDYISERIQEYKQNKVLINTELYLPKYLYNFQIDAITSVINRVVEGFRGYNLFFEVGLGKTITSLIIAKNLNKKVVIFCPAPLILQWRNEILKFNLAAEHEINIISGVRHKRFKLWNEDKKWNILTYESFRNDKFVMDNCFIISDEASKLKNSGTKIYTEIKKLARNNFILLLTATPIENSLMDIYNLCQISHPSFMSWYEFSKNHVIWDDINGNSIISGFKNENIFFNKIKPFSILIKKKDVLKELPKIIIEYNEIDNSNYKDIFYKLLQKNDIFKCFQLLRILENGTKEFFKSESLLIKHIPEVEISSNKLEYLKDLLTDIIDDKIIIFTSFIRSADIIFNAIKDNKRPVFIITGNTGDKLNLIEEFKNSKRGILICTDTLNYGVSFSDVSVVINYELVLNPAKLIQRIGRAARINNPNTIMVFNLYGNLIEEHILKILQNKGGLINNFEQEMITIPEDTLLLELSKVMKSE